MKKLQNLAFATFAFVTLSAGHAFAGNPENGNEKKQQPSSDKDSIFTGTDCTYTKTAIGYAAIDCRGQTIIRGPFSQSCTKTGPCGTMTENATQECANAALGGYIALQIQQMIAACKDQP